MTRDRRDPKILAERLERELLEARKQNAMLREKIAYAKANEVERQRAAEKLVASLTERAMSAERRKGRLHDAPRRSRARKTTKPARARAIIPIIFQHIPKTAGVSVRALMSSNFHVDEILHVPDVHWRDRLFAKLAISKYRFIHGHLHYEFFAALAGSVRLITFLRDPVERIISLYFFLKGQSPEGVEDPVSRTMIENAHAHTIDRFVALTDHTVTASVSNFQAAMLLT